MLWGVFGVVVVRTGICHVQTTAVCCLGAIRVLGMGSAVHADSG